MPRAARPPRPAARDIGEGKFLHYVFAQARSNASNLPLVLWLNGGPGVSVGAHWLSPSTGWL